jgi:hypothetical protein
MPTNKEQVLGILQELHPDATPEQLNEKFQGLINPQTQEHVSTMNAVRDELLFRKAQAQQTAETAQRQQVQESMGGFGGRTLDALGALGVGMAGGDQAAAFRNARADREARAKAESAGVSPTLTALYDPDTVLKTLGTFGTESRARAAEQRTAEATPLELTAKRQGIAKGELELTQAQKKIQEESESKDPQSAKSAFMRTVIAKQFPSHAGLVEGKSAADLEQLYPKFKDALDQAYRSEQANLQREDLATQRRIAEQHFQTNLDVQKGIREALRTDKESREAEQKQEKEIKRTTLTEPETRPIVEADKALTSIDGIIGSKSSIDTGLVAKMRHGAAGLVGVEDPNVDTMSDNLQALRSYLTQTKGLQHLAPQVPTIGENDKSFNAKISNIKAGIEANRKAHLSTLQKRGKNVTEFTQPDLPATETTPEYAVGPAKVSPPKSTTSTKKPDWAK